MMELSTTNFEQITSGDIPVLVDFWAGWCMPCKMFAPVLEELSDELDGKASICKLNIDDYPTIAQKYGVESIPTSILFKKGAEVDRIVGLRPKDQVKLFLEKHM